MSEHKNESESGDDSTTAQWRDNKGIVTLGGSVTFSGTTVVGDNASVTANEQDKKEKR